MDTFPIIWLVSILMILAAYTIAWNTRIPSRSRFFFSAFFILLTVVTFFLGARIAFDWLWPAQAQPFAAILAAPSAYLGFAALEQEDGQRWYAILLRNGGLVALGLLGLAAPISVSADVFILAINCFYLVCLANLLSHSSDDFASVPPHATGLLRASIFATIALVGLMVIADGLVFSVTLVAREPHLISLLTGISGLFAGFIFVVALTGIPMILNLSQKRAPIRGSASNEDRVLMQSLESLMQDKELFRDSNLTLTRVAKRLSVPARDLSGAINRLTQENFSRFINGHRIAYAQRALVTTDLPVTEIMLDAGFLSKSSFNTEFRRVTELTPSQYRARRADVDAAQR